jgi:uncharacterized protein (DUF58 family)
MGTGLLVREPSIVAWGGALIVGLAIARAVTELSVARVRLAGFEMLWRGSERLRRAARGETVELEAEIRNRDTRAARYVALRPVCSPQLSVRVEPSEGEVPASGRLTVTVHIETPRVGRHGVHGLSLEVQGSPGLFEVPLTFANPYGVEVLPRPFSLFARSARGGRSRLSAVEGQPGPLSGDGTELRELREHRSGDPFKRIAWKASAKRGQLMVIDFEREERDVVWLVIDASVEHWSGVAGRAPLDLAIDEAAGVAQRHLARGDQVGLLIVAARLLARVPPDRTPNHLMKLFSALSEATGCADADRSDLDEADVALRVLEHMRPLDPTVVARLRSRDLDRIVQRADRLRARAPFPKGHPFAPSRRERNLRRYLMAFGLYLPARLEPEQQKTDLQIARALEELPRSRPRPSLLYVWSPAPSAGRREVLSGLLPLRRRRIDVRWISMRNEAGILRSEGVVEEAVADAVALRARLLQERGERALRQLGVRVDRLRSERSAGYSPWEPVRERARSTGS